MIDRRVTREVGAWTVALSCASAQEAAAESVLNAIEALAQRRRLHGGLRVRFGWSVLTLTETAPRWLTVCEPDFDRDPLQDIRPGVAATLDVIARQAAVARAAAVTPVDVSFEQYIIVGRDAISAREVHLFRDEAESEEDTGWRLTRAGEEPSNDENAFDAIRVYTLLRSRMVVLSALILPREFAVVIEGNSVVAILDSDGQSRI